MWDDLEVIGLAFGHHRVTVECREGVWDGVPWRKVWAVCSCGYRSARRLTSEDAWDAGARHVCGVARRHRANGLRVRRSG